MTLTHHFRRVPVVLILLLCAISVRAQVSVSPYGEGSLEKSTLPLAKVEEKLLTQLDLGREVILFDALPDGSHWFVVDRFGLLKSMVIDGVRVQRDFNEIPMQTALYSPKGDYLIWLGLERHASESGFDSTIVYIYKDAALVGSFQADYTAVQFSRTGKSWGVTMPYASVLQQGDRDLVMINGAVVGKDLGRPRDLSFDHTETRWAYRATENQKEYLVTRSGAQIIGMDARQSDAVRGTASMADTVKYYFTPDVNFRGMILEGRDYDLGFSHAAILRRTSEDPAHLDTSHMYLRFEGKNSPMFRWIKNVLIDSAGDHTAYFACDPSQEGLGAKANERMAIVIHDGRVIAGPFTGVGRMFMSPSGAHIAFESGTDIGNLYLDTRIVAKGVQARECVWSHDEKQIAFSASGTHGKVFVVLGGKRSREYEKIGRMEWLPNGKGVRYVALLDGRLYKVKQLL